MKMLLLCSATALCLMGTPASAQSADQAPNGEARKTAAIFAGCLVDQSGRAWRMQLLKPYGGAGTNTAIDKLLRSNCLNAKGDMQRVLRFPRLVFRGFMFDALYRDSFGATAATDFAGVAPLIYPIGDGVNDETARPYLVNMALGDCVARQAPGAARTFMLTAVETPEETTALQALASAFQMCVPEGAALTLTRWKARSAIAEPLYRLTQAQVNP